MAKTRIAYVVDPKSSKISMAYIIDPSSEPKKSAPRASSPSSGSIWMFPFTLIKYLLILAVVIWLVQIGLIILAVVVGLFVFVVITALLFALTKSVINRLR